MRRTATAARSWNSLPDSPPELLRGVAEIISHQQSTGSVFRDFEDLCQRLRERTMDNLRAARNGVSSKGVRRKRTKDRRRSGREELPWTVGMDDDTSSDGRQEPFVYGPDESAAYVGFRMPSAVALTTRLLEGLAEHDASFAPTSVIDFGAGPASTLWAIDEVWPGAMQRAVCIEPSQSMATAGRMLARGLRSSAAVEWIPSINHLFGQRGSRAAAQAQLVVAANVLGELPSDAGRSAAVELLWRTVAPNGALLISEPGSPWGSQVVRAARQGLLDAHGSSSSPRSDLGDGTQPDIIAPCPHSERCPMDAGDEARREAARRFIDPLDLDEAAEERLLAAEAAADAAAEAAGVVAGNSSGFVQWCHFAHRAPTHAVHTQHERSSRGASGKIQPKFSYVLIRKGDATQRAPRVNEVDETSARVISRPLKRKGHVIVDVCTPSGVAERRVVSKRKLKGAGQGDAYKMARKVRWGEEWPASLGERKRY